MVREPETDALRAFLAAAGARPLVTSALARTELQRAVLRFAHRSDVSPTDAAAAAQEAVALLRRLDLVRVGAVLLDRAGRQLPPSLRSLDAIHLVTALGLGPLLDAVVAYDERLADAARQAGIAVHAPTAASGTMGA